MWTPYLLPHVQELLVRGRSGLDGGEDVGVVLRQGQICLTSK